MNNLHLALTIDRKPAPDGTLLIGVSIDRSWGHFGIFFYVDRESNYWSKIQESGTHAELSNFS